MYSIGPAQGFRRVRKKVFLLTNYLNIIIINGLKWKSIFALVRVKKGEKSQIFSPISTLIVIFVFEGQNISKIIIETCRCALA